MSHSDISNDKLMVNMISYDEFISYGRADSKTVEFKALMVKNFDWVKGFLENNPLKNNPDVNEDDRTLCDGCYSER